MLVSKKEFELYLVGSVFNSLKEPAIIDSGDEHSIYKTPLMFYEFQRLMKKINKEYSKLNDKIKKII